MHRRSTNMWRGLQSARHRGNRGAALVTVLWLTAALAIIAFSVAATVRSEMGRAENSIDAARAELLARGAIERAFFFFTNPPQPQPGRIPDYQPGQQRMYWNFPGGEAVVDILPESGKLNVNSATVQQVATVMLAAGYPPQMANPIAAAIVDWRTPPPGGTSTLDSYYLSVSPTFRPRHASFQQIEELLMVQGVTPRIYHGAPERVPGGGVVYRPGLYDLLSVFGATGIYDANSAPPAVLAAAGLGPGDILMIQNLRRTMPIPYEVLERTMLSIGPANRILRVGNDQAYTIKATAKPRRPDGGISDFRWSSAALVVYETVSNNYQVPRLRAWRYGTASDSVPSFRIEAAK